MTRAATLWMTASGVHDCLLLGCGRLCAAAAGMAADIAAAAAAAAAASAAAGFLVRIPAAAGAG